MFALTTDDVLVRIRERIHDRTGQTFDDAEVLRAADDSLRSIFDMLRIHGESRGLDYVDVNMTTDLQILEEGVRQYQLPEWVADIQFIEARGGTTMSVPIAHATLEEKDLARGTFRASGTLWNWGPPGAIQIRGDFAPYPTLRIWFIRAIPPMCHITANSAGGKNYLICTAATSEGMLVRTGAYVASQFQLVAGSANDLQKIVRCTIFDVIASVATLTFTPGFIDNTTTASRLSMIVPLDPQHSEYLCDMAAMALMRRQGSKEEVAMLAGAVMQSQATFEAGIARRQSGEPPRFSSSRRRR